MRYSAPLDGLRAVAILAVLIFHVAPGALTGGFTGVDVFFVLSGFLITSNMLHDVSVGDFSIREFYLRRVQRLLPNVIVTVILVLALWTLLLPPSTARQTGSHGLWALFSASNLYIWKYLGGYWGNAATSAPFTHTWSLGVEEQFYLVFPALLLALTRWCSTYVRSCLIALAAVSFGAGFYISYVNPAAAFYLLPTRVWELLIGAALAAGSLAVMPRYRDVVGWIGVAVIVSGFVAINERQLFPGAVALIPTMGTLCLLVAIADHHSRWSRWLSHPWMVAIGKLSYSLYLWHWPLITLGKIQAELHGQPPLAGAAVGGAVSVLMAWLAYVLVEQPLRQRGPGRTQRLAVIAAGFLVAVAGSAVIASRPLVADPDHRFDRPEFHGMLFDTGPSPATDMSSVVHYYDVYFPKGPALATDTWRTGGIVHRYGGERPFIVVLGSSHALMYSRLIDDLCREHGVSVAFLGADQQSAFFESSNDGAHALVTSARAYDDARREWLRQYRPDAVIVMDRWEVRAATPADFATRLRYFVDEVNAFTDQIVWVAQVPVIAGNNIFNLREFAAWRLKNGTGLPSLLPDVHEPLRQGIVDAAEALARQVPTLQVLRADTPFYQAGGGIRYVNGRRFFYADDNHLTDAGTEEVRDMFSRAIRAIRVRSSR